MRSVLLGIMLVPAAVMCSCSSAPDVTGPACGDSRACNDTPPKEDSGAHLCVPDPAAAPPDDRCGVFVSSSLGSDGNTGTQRWPVRSMERALSLAQRGSRRIYACAEVFLAPVLLPAGVELWGGLDCVTDWSYVGETRKTTLAPGPDAIPLRVDTGEGVSRVADVRAEAVDASLPSGSSTAVMVMPEVEVEFLRSEFVAGNGAPGADGEDGSVNAHAQAGAPGLPGGAACSADIVPGGQAVSNVCDEFTSIGGQGGQGNVTVGSAGQDGQPEPASNSIGWGKGGVGETSEGLQCKEGFVGWSGTDGEHAKGATGPGRLTLEGWEGDDGQDGGNGLPGQGGGGGGGARGGAYLCGSMLNKAGASGGSGGAGGCGGKGGKGGRHGGASIGLLSLSDQVTIRATTIATGKGGDGGMGGFPQLSGLGGASGPGGTLFNSADPGCPGGPGGHGGHGGFGGGGVGGPSIGIAHLQGATVVQEDVTIRVGLFGQGGLGGGVEFSVDGTGEDGIAAEVLAFP